MRRREGKTGQEIYSLGFSGRGDTAKADKCRFQPVRQLQPHAGCVPRQADALFFGAVADNKANRTQGGVRNPTRSGQFGNNDLAHTAIEAARKGDCKIRR